ncbi:bifunctional folylpolyglutamate synthase/dihydrofolate synthase [Vulgatibacter incomptus]|uniref:Dihydrofolate synthase/folylpolyglutamate synthase n=1 Tax=Vulgatibacter incomptus TaxID=1391653 RepID=A0A0K1P8M7_9BACT|nr:folylpolyglutamate synthase/dihydrofolate synthase family protein [Vulgatibacter incomptus]AKU89875.1 Dihydrofolate synthase [Vulgatibacter incomptus]
MTKVEELLATLPQSSIHLGLERITAACQALGDPQGRFDSVLVAGTNGKGSTCAFLASALARTGRKVGLYTSPHLVSFRERIRIDGAPISSEALERAGARLRAVWPPFGDHPDALTYFEAATALAFEAFAQAGVEIAVLEVGLGGRLDATNVPGTRLCATAITRIGFDHMEYLGTTLDAIAGEKAAIARFGVPMVVAPQPDEAMEAIRRKAETVSAPLVEVGRDAALVRAHGGLEYRGPDWALEGLTLGLAGEHQLQNAAVAVAVLEAAVPRLGAGPDEAREGLAEARWPGRLEVISAAWGERPRVILDGAHNPDGALALAESFPRLWPGVRPQVVFGVLGDKDRLPMMRAIFPLAGEVHLCLPPSPRAVPTETLAQEAASFSARLHLHPSPESALEAASSLAGPAGTVLVCGSLYLVGAIRGLICGAP